MSKVRTFSNPLKQPIIYMKQAFLSFIFICLIYALHAQKQDHVKGQILVQLLFNHKITELSTPLQRLKMDIIKSNCLSEDLNIWQLDFDESVDEKKLLFTIRSHPSVLNAQFNHYVELRSILTTVPNDPFFNNQWHLMNTGQSGGTVGADIQATQAWDITTGGRTTDGDTIVVAVIDNGFEPTHADIQANHWYNWNEIPNNGIDDDRNGYVDDFQGWNTKTLKDDIAGGNTHAVKVEGMLGAVGNNSRGISGVNWKVKMMSIKIDTERGTEADVVAAYNYALVMRRLYQKSGGKKGAFIVATNSSFGSSGFASDAPIWCAMYDSLGIAGIISVGSTANSNINVDLVGDLPSTCPSDYLVVVTATDRNDLKGANVAYGVNNVDVAAPGIAVYTTAQNGSYIQDEGTSFACPIVAGIVALAYSVPCTNFTNLSKTNPKAAALFLKNWILTSVDTKPDLQNKIRTGGRVNAFKTLQKVLNYCSACQQPSSVSVSATTMSASISFKVAASSSFQARYRIKNSTNWTAINGTAPPLSIPGLTSCTEYELELKSTCNADISAPLILPFKTDGCCTPPDNIEVLNLSQNQFTLRFSKVTAALGYILCVKESNSSSCVFEKTLNDTSVTINNLKICTAYQVSIKSNCAAQPSPEVIIPIKTAGCGPCFDLTYCKTGGSTSSEWIDSFAISDFKSISGKNGGYIKFDTIATVLKAGKKYQLALKPAFSGPSFNEGLRVWIDYNGDGDFDDAGEQIWEVLKFNANVKSDSILIPTNITEGVTRMRVAMKFVGALGMPPQNCEIFDGGEVEDYCVRLDKSSAIAPIIAQSELVTYPNPFSNYFIINNKNQAHKILKVELMYADGRIFYTKRFDAMENEYLVADLPPLSTSLIFLKIETDKGVLIKKMTHL